MSIEHSFGESTPSVLVTSIDEFFLHIEGDETYPMSRAQLSVLAEIIYRALNTSQDELDA